MNPEAVIVVTGFEPFGSHTINPSGELAKEVDGRRVGACVVRAAVLPVEHTAATAITARLLDEADPVAVLQLGLAEGRARIGLERVAINVRDYPLPDAVGYVASDEPCVAGGPAAYFSTLPLRRLLAALTAEGVPAYLSNSAGTYLCNQTMYATLHAIVERGRRTPAGFMHVPLLPSMVGVGIDQPSMDSVTTLRALEAVLRVLSVRD